VRATTGVTNGTLTFANAVGGPGTMIITDTASDALEGTVFLNSTANTYSGGTIVNGGVLDATAGNLGATTGKLTVGAQLPGATATTLVKLNTSSPTTTGPLSGVLLNGGTATIDNGGQLFTVNQTTAGTYPGVITGAGGFTLGALSNNVLTLSGANSYNGGTTVSAGTLKLAVGAALPTNNAVAVDGTGNVEIAASGNGDIHSNTNTIRVG